MNQSKPPSADIPIIFCNACNQAPMIAKTINQHFLDKDGTDVEFECPKCGARSSGKLLCAPAVNQDA